MDEGKIKTLYTCGGSYMSVDQPPAQITSFLELYARDRNFKHVSLARIGVSNFGIRLQIDEAIRRQADYVIVSTVPSERIDVVLNTKIQHGWFSLNNVVYHNYGCVSEYNLDDYDPKIVCDTVDHSLNNRSELTDIQKQSIKKFVADLQNPSVERQKDYYIIASGLYQLQQKGIPFLLLPDGMKDLDWAWVENVWPSDRLSPMEMPDQNSKDIISVTHNNQPAHYELKKTLESLTPNWC